MRAVSRLLDQSNTFRTDRSVVKRGQLAPRRAGTPECGASEEIRANSRLTRDAVPACGWSQRRSRELRRSRDHVLFSRSVHELAESVTGR